MKRRYAVHYHKEGDYLPYKYTEVLTKSLSKWMKEAVKRDPSITIMEHYQIQ